MPFVLNEAKEVYFDKSAYDEHNYLQVHFVFDDKKNKEKTNLILVRFYSPNEIIKSPKIITASKLDKQDILGNINGGQYIKIK